MDPPFTIVLAVDLSRPSAAALRFAADLARRLGARVVLTHALSHAGRGPDEADEHAPSPGEHGGRTAAVESVQQWADALREEGIDTEVDARVGDPKDVVLSAVEHHGADLVVMGRRGLGRAQRFLMGSVTRDVLAESRVPVTVVPAG